MSWETQGQRLRGVKRAKGTKTHVAHAGDTVLARLEQVDERDDDPAAGRAKGVTERDGAARDVELLGRDVENLLIGNGDGREGLVDLELGHLVDGDARALERDGDGLCRRDGEVDGRARGVGEGCGGIVEVRTWEHTTRRQEGRLGGTYRRSWRAG